MATAKTVLRATHQEAIVKVAGTASAQTISLTTDLLPIAGQILTVGGTPTVNIVGVTWTGGTGGLITITRDSVVVMMNTTNDFTPLPVSNQTFTAMNGTYTSGRQVIYVGTKSTFTVNVPSATDQYYFRAFDFQTNNGMTRYITTSSLDGVVLNPILCDLEDITLNASTFKLTRATLGATIKIPKKSSITEKGIYWSYSPGVSEADIPLQDFNDTDGSFSFPDEVIGRGVTIYYKGYATNQSGTIWTAEASLNNTPIFSGTGIWDNATRWNVQEVPGSHGDATYGDVADSPIINGTCTQTVSHDVTDLTINAGKSLQINAAIEMNVTGTLTNDAGVSGILIKSSSSAANGSLKFANGSPSARVEMYSKANWNLSNPVNNKYKWQFFGIPVKTIQLETHST
ncbi:MAG: hypothetical protein WCQ44_06485 [Opitutaceae bacterium]